MEPEQPTSAQIEEAARVAGLDYVYQPVVAGQITEMDVRTFANHFNELPKPVLMFLPYRQSLKQLIPTGEANGPVR